MEIRPRDWKTWKYWLHLGIISVVIFGILEILSQLNVLGFVVGLHMFTLTNILISIPIIGVSDIFSHSLLKID